MRNLEKSSYKCTITRLLLYTNDANSRPFSVYAYGNATPQTLHHLLNVKCPKPQSGPCVLQITKDLTQMEISQWESAILLYAGRSTLNYFDFQTWA